MEHPGTFRTTGGGSLGLAMPSLPGAADRCRPNILVTGTPGTGKTTTCEMLVEATGMRHVDVGKWVREQSLHLGRDEEFDCYFVDEDKVCDALEDVVAAGGVVVDHHGCDFFPERWFDLVLVLQADTAVLYERLKTRGYSDKKLSENMECEIMNVCLEEAMESYKSEIVQQMQSNTVEQMEENVEKVAQWVAGWNPQAT